MDEVKEASACRQPSAISSQPSALRLRLINSVAISSLLKADS
jgi:hypothetical protein